MKMQSSLRMLQQLAVWVGISVSVLCAAHNSANATTLTLTPGSLQPDTVFQEFPFTLSFTIGFDSLPGSVDSGFATIAVLRASDSSLLGVLFDGDILPVSATDSSLSYADLTAQAINWGLPATGTFALQLSYHLYSGDSVAQLQTILPAGIRRMPALAISYQTGTLSPTSIEPGTTHTFGFDVLSLDPYALVVDESQSRLYFEGNTFSDTASLSFPYDSLLPAIQSFTSGNVTIPANLANDTFTVSGTIAIIPKSLAGSGVSPYLYSLPFGGDKVVVQTVPKPQVQIVSVVVEAPNTPKVNMNQPFSVHAVVANRSDVAVGPVSCRLVSDGNSTFTPDAVIQFIPAHGQADVAIDVVAENAPSSGEVFRLEITSFDVSAMPPLDDVAFIIIEQPASLKFSAALFGVQGGVVGYGQAFTLNISLQNTGEATVNEATYLLTTDGVSFGVPDSIGGSITAGQNLVFNFRAPAFDTQAVIAVKLLTHPIDANLGLPAPLDIDSAAFNITVRAPGGELLIEPAQVAPNVLAPNRLIDMFSLHLTNRLTLSGARIRLQNMTVDFSGINGEDVDPSAFIDWSVSGIYHGNELISVPTPSGSRVFLAISKVSLSPQDTTTLMLRLQLKPSAPKQFRFLQTLSDILAILEGSTRAAQVVTTMPSTFLFSEAYAVIGTTLESSFIVNNNPYDPADGPALFSYELKESADIIFRIYTVTGELVLEEEFPAGGEQTTVGSHLLSWDGRNGDGDKVVNGVYIAIITNTQTGESARIKLAVVQ